MYEARISNKYSYGNTILKSETLSEIKNKLSQYLMDTGSEVKIYEIKEISVDKDWYERWDPSKYEYNTNWGSKTLYEDGCIHKSSVSVRTTD